MGNLRSIANAVHELGYDVLILSAPSQWDDISHLILPGVGHFGAAMEVVRKAQWLPPICEYQRSGRPLLGICLGMQLLADSGAEGGIHQGLGILPGTVRRLQGSPGHPVPHIGWNVLRVERDHPVFAGLKKNRDFYFVHSYEFHCSRITDRLAVTDFDHPVTAVVGHENVIGFQFHPEKSQVNGLRLIENFCEWNGRC